MTQNKSQPQRSAFSLWMQAMRPFSFTASITPVLLGTAIAFFRHDTFNFIYFIAALFGGFILHAGTNLISEYFDLKRGADRHDTYGSSRLLVEGLMDPKRVLMGGFVAFGIAFLIGIYLVSVFGMTIVILGLIALFGGYFYTGGPFGLKYRAFGEPLVSTLMGPLMVFGAYYVQYPYFSWIPFLISVPIAILVAGILNANNFRDIPHDNRAGFTTIPGKLGWVNASTAYRLLIASAFVSLLLLVIFSLAPLWALVALIAILPTMKLFQIVKHANPMVPQDLATLDVSTAQVHFLFGILLTIGFVIGALV